MNLLLNDIHVNARSLAERLINAKAWTKDHIHVPELSDTEKRFLRKHEIEYSYDSRIHEWEIIIPND